MLELRYGGEKRYLSAFSPMTIFPKVWLDHNLVSGVRNFLRLDALVNPIFTQCDDLIIFSSKFLLLNLSATVQSLTYQ